MYVLKPGDPEPTTILSDTDSEHSRPSSAGSRPTSANRIHRVVPSVKRKTTNDENDEKYLKDLSELNLSSSKSSSIHSIGEQSSDKEMKVEPVRQFAPVELVTEFLACVMTREFTKAKALCQKILEIEPENETCKEFANVINIALMQENEKASESSDESESDSEISDDDSGLSDDSDDGDSSPTDDDDDDDDDVSVSEDSDESDDDGDEISVDDVNKLNLLMGGIQIVKNT